MTATNKKKLEESIVRFLAFFGSRLDEVEALNCGQSTILYRKLLYSSVLDALARTTSHPKKENRERIVEFVRQFCEWADCDRISLPHLARLLEKVPDPAFSELRMHVFSELDKWEDGELITLNRDLDFGDAKKLWPREIPKPLADIHIEFLQHVNLFYRYRNSLVHELRKPGYGMEFQGDPEPHYLSMKHMDTNQETWELVYPIQFYEMLCQSAVDNLKDYYLQNRIDPYSCYVFGTYWIEELNI